jgi:two-component system, chemotaxis family, protein-glutamate methylesterase/glutaminase
MSIPMNTAVAAARAAPIVGKPIRVMVVDDAIVVRRQLTRWIGDEKDMLVAACVRTGREAIDQLEACNPDVVVLDVDMPELDGLSALPELLKRRRDLVVIMASTLTRRSADISLRALSLGAADYVPKPEAALDADSSAAFRREYDEPIVAGGVYVAPGGRHMRVARGATGPVIALGDDPPVNFCRPSIDLLMKSAAQVFGAASLALILTGMGSDGSNGAAEIAAAGGSVIAQDEETSVVWGMPRADALAGLCSAVLPLRQIPAEINRLFVGGRT